MISVSDALDHVLSLTAPLETQTVSLRASLGRTLATDALATRNQPPFSASIMDGYALRDDESKIGATFTVIGEAAAGHTFEGTVGAGQAVRIFTGAPLPKGASRVVMQENVRRDGQTITQTDVSRTTNIRDIGADFKIGDTLEAPKVLTPRDLTLLAAMNIAEVTVTRQPIVALLATGDELVMPGETPNEAQIIASNAFGLAGMIENAGGIARILPIARDSEASLTHAFSLAEGADMIVTIGGASVGDHDIVGKVATDLGLERAFYKVAMRPGKPLMAGKLNGAVMLGLPGNPVSSIVTAHLFMIPALRAMQGLGHHQMPMRTAMLADDLPANGPRAHYMRAQSHTATNGQTVVQHSADQDSALMRTLSQADVLIVRAPSAPAQAKGDQVEIMAL
jgi:molybdopterin molybdotransferase